MLSYFFLGAHSFLRIWQGKKEGERERVRETHFFPVQDEIDPSKESLLSSSHLSRERGRRISIFSSSATEWSDVH